MSKRQANKNNPWTFIPFYPTATEKKAVNAVMKEPPLMEDILNELLEDGITIKFSWREEQEAYSVTLSNTERGNPNYQHTLACFHVSPLKACVLMREVLKNLDGKPWATILKTDDKHTW